VTRRGGRGTVDLPHGVHRVIARGREYFYYHPGRGTASAGDRLRLPNDPHSPEFWTALRQTQGVVGTVATDTVDALVDDYIAAWPTLPEKLSDGTQSLYRRNLKRARNLWGKLPATGLRPAHIHAVMRDLADTPGEANNFLSTMRALSAWARVQPDGLIDRSLCEGVRDDGDSISAGADRSRRASGRGARSSPSWRRKWKPGRNDPARSF